MLIQIDCVMQRIKYSHPLLLITHRLFMNQRREAMLNRRFLLLIFFPLFQLYVNAFAGDMKIGLQNDNVNILFYDGDIINEISSRIDEAPQITVEDIFLCPQAKEGIYWLTIQKKDGVRQKYIVSDNFQVYTENSDGYPVTLSCKILNELREILIQYLISNFI